jgi:hypothetical protein
VFRHFEQIRCGRVSETSIFMGQIIEIMSAIRRPDFRLNIDVEDGEWVLQRRHVESIL